MMKTKRSFIGQFLKTSLLMAGIMLFLTSAGQEINSSFGDWDVDQDDRISENEFSDGLFSQGANDAGLFDDDDKDRQGLTDFSYDDNQFYESSYDWWDTNNDNLLDENEWNYGYENSYGDYLDDDFDAYDTDGDNYLGYDEYNSSLIDTDYYSSWDSNNDDLLDNDEYSAGVFDTWDANDDSYLDEDEFGEFNQE